MYNLEQHTERQVFKNAETHNFYHRCLCFNNIILKTT